MTAEVGAPAPDQAGKDRIRKALTSLALARQAEFEDGAQRVYLHLLGDLDPAMVGRACHSWALRPRGEYAPAMPSAADIRETVEDLARQDLAEDRRARLAPAPVDDADGPRYFCLACRDETSGWRHFWCQGRGPHRSFDRPDRSEGSTVECGRPQDHHPHQYVTRCECYETNPVSAKRRARERASRPQETRRKGAA